MPERHNKDGHQHHLAHLTVDQRERIDAVQGHNDRLRALLGRSDEGPADEKPPWAVQAPELTSGPDGEVEQKSSIKLKGTGLEGIQEAAFLPTSGGLVSARVESSGPKRVKLIVPTGVTGMARVWVRGQFGEAYSQFQVRVTVPDRDDPRGDPVDRDQRTHTKAH